jgi:hypothetical protein
MTDTVKNKSREIKATNRWFRFYSEALDDPKVQRLPPNLFKTWVNVLCIACQNGGTLPSIDDMAFKLRLSSQDAEQQISELILAGLIDITDAGRVPHNWNMRQFLSDSSTERVKKHRKIKAETPCNVSETADVTPPDTDTDTDTDQNRADSEQILLVADAPKPKRESQGSRLDRDWQLPDDWRQWARTTFPQTTAERLTVEADTFRDYWISAPSQRGRKADWEATWRNWCRKAFATGPLRPNAQPPPPANGKARTLAEALAKRRIANELGAHQ